MEIIGLIALLVPAIIIATTGAVVFQVLFWLGIAHDPEFFFILWIIIWGYPGGKMTIWLFKKIFDWIPL